MSLGFVPAILTIVLYGIINHNAAVYTGTAVGVVWSLLDYFLPGKRVPAFMLYTVTGVLAVFSALTLIGAAHALGYWYVLLIEASILLTLLPLYLYRTSFVDYFKKHIAPARRCLYVQAAESMLVAVRVVCIMAAVHLVALVAGVALGADLGSSVALLLVGPALVFLASIGFNQLGISFFNKEMAEEEFIPVVNESGGVTGRVMHDDIPELRNDVALPLVRIVIETHGMLYLVGTDHKVDTPLEDYVLFTETVEQAAERIVRQAITVNAWLDPRFSVKYKYQDANISRLVYLFVMHIDDDSVLFDCKFQGGKPWLVEQIKQNLGKNYFSEMLEGEFEHLRSVIDIREKYTAS